MEPSQLWGNWRRCVTITSLSIVSPCLLMTPLHDEFPFLFIEAVVAWLPFVIQSFDFLRTPRLLAPACRNRLIRTIVIFPARCNEKFVMNKSQLPQSNRATLCAMLDALLTKVVAQCDKLSWQNWRRPTLYRGKKQNNWLSSEFGTRFESWLIVWVKVLRPTRHKISHFGDIHPSQSFGVVCWRN